MRPVILTMEGFASFRDRAELDFRGIDYFALVGRTGAGKSTVIDALTFALYGTAHRWGHATSIANALAPTANQATVSLLLDVNGHRYHVVREVRRTKQGVQQRNATLELLADPNGLGGTDEPPGRTLTTDVRDVSRKVTQLLGLDFDEFCTCVVLPQGKFAEFLTADRRRRREILARFLGEHRYGQMRQLALQRSHARQATAQTLTGQLEQLPDHDDDSLAALAERRDALARLSDDVAARVHALRTDVQALARLQQDVDDHDATLGRLHLTMPPEVEELETLHQQARAAVTAAEGSAEAAEQAAAQARTAQQQGPQIAAAQDAVTRHRRLDLLTGTRLPQLGRDVTAAGQQAADARTDVEGAEHELEEARVRDEAARQELAVTITRSTQVRRAREVLAGLVVPAGAADHAAQGRRIEEDWRQAVEEDERITSQLEDARAGAAVSRPLANLDRLVERWHELSTQQGSLAEIQRQHDTAQQAVDAATTGHEQAKDVHEAASVELRTLQDRDIAAGLRAGLQVGDDCPVCAQPVTILPAGGSHPDLHAAEQGVQQAVVRLREAENELATARLGHSRTEAQLEARTSAVEALQEQLAGTTETEIRVEQQTARERADELTAAEAAWQQSVAQRRRAEQQREQHREQGTALTQSLHAALRTLAAVADAPTVDTDEGALGWQQLSEWLQDELARHDDVLVPAAEQAREQQERSAADAVDALAAARTSRTQAAEAAESAVRRSDRLHQELENARTEADGLTETLAGSDETSAEAQLREAQELADRVHAADGEVTSSRQSLRDARSRLEKLEAEVRQHRTELTGVRDTVVHLGAPAPHGDSLLADWEQLCTWADEMSRRVADERSAAAGAHTGARTALVESARELRVLLTEYDVGGSALPEADLAGLSALSDTAATAAARAHTLAEQEHRAAERARARRAELLVERDVAVIEQQLASRLADLLQASRFLDWLTTSILTRLVSDASETLRHLSGGQFSLTSVERADLVVVDHHDADSTRSVKTLSGGETFQASLALALALSDHMAALGAGGTSRLESIFLDEGFGTLDPDALTTVADTLENLAEGDRMVGVVTHVQQLADRVPHRFLIERNSRTSTLTVQDDPA